MEELNGKVVLITGGVGGLGQCITKNLLESGMTVVLFDLSAERGEEAKKNLEAEYGKGRVHFIRGDVTKKEDIEGAFKEAIEKCSRIDVLINNAGIMNDDIWEAEIEINLKGLVMGTKEAMKHMCKEHGGNGGLIINISSILGLKPFPLTPVYTATKHAVIGFSRSYGYPMIYSKTGVRVITVCPGITDTALWTCSSFGDMLTKFIETRSEEERSKHPSQKPEAVGAVFPKLIREAKTGSVWVVEDSKPAYMVDIPEYVHMRVDA